ncbi:MAG: amidohydrolase [Cytophagaceae bacterium]|nr:amidohydrolase [Cytophagaceae bacterium]MBL0300927.1 amidohydrolase [Cytophagaceae bacterium]MBL0323740.1 amidohydrolase [Cytophagaceae bacterium]
MKKTFLLILLLSVGSFAQKRPVDLMISNAKVYTVNAAFKIETAFVVDKGRIVEVSSLSNLQKKFSPKKTIDLGGKAVFPGFYDPHSHFIGFGEMLSQCDLVGAESFEEILERLKEFRIKNPDNEWIIGRGWDQNDWKIKEFPNNEALDAIFPDIPVMLTRIDGHALLANSKALQLAKISPASKVPGGAVEVLDGQLTGILIDNAMGLLKRVMPGETEAQMRKMILEAQKECFKVGLTTVSEAGASQEDIELLMKMHNEGSLKIRDYVMVSVGLRNLDYFTKRGIIKTDRINVRSFKIYGDGALGSRGACLLKPYSDDPGNSGFLLTSKNEMDKFFEQIYKSDYQANTHCIGDSANRLVLDLYGKYLKQKNNRRWRIEHCQVVNPSDVPKFSKFSIIPSVQATHATSDMYWAGKRLGAEREKHAYAFNDLMKQNGVLANGSDFPVEYINPLFSFHAAVARQDAKNWPEGGFQNENAISRKEALKAMTLWSAYANFEEKERGSIEQGKMADFVVLEEDIMTIELSKIRSVKVLQTWVGGERVY